jgi:hypothetical protein
MGVTVMRALMIAAAATLLLLPAAAPAMARGRALPSAQAGSSDYSAKTHKKPMKKAAKKKKQKVDYMRAVPMK